MVDAELVTSQSFIGWINYLFHEHFPLKNRDPWKLFEAMHNDSDMEQEELSEYNWEDFVYDIYGAIGYFEIKSVLEGTDAVIMDVINESEPESEEEKGNAELSVFDHMKNVRHFLREYRQDSSLDEQEQLSILLKMLRTYYEQDSPRIAGEFEDKKLMKLLFSASLSDAPAFVIKSLAEVYEKDFWELWNQIKEVARRKWIYAGELTEVPPISTMDFFNQDPDDMIIFWKGDGEIEFSENLRKWFLDLSDRYTEIIKSGFLIKSPMNWILNLMEYADENYYHIYTFNNFWEETMEHLNDSRYLALWKIYDEMLHDPEMESAGSVIFIPGEFEVEHIGSYYAETRPRRRLRMGWGVMHREKKYNKARVTFRRYMALVANGKLRKEVFGF